MPKIEIPSDSDLIKSGQTYRTELLEMPIRKLAPILQHMRLRSGVRYKETVGQLSGETELGPYSNTRKDENGFNIAPRTLETFLGSVVKPFDPNTVYQTIYDAKSPMSGAGLQQKHIAQLMAGYMAKKVGESLSKVIWSAKRNESGDKSIDLFNGFDTITDAEITAGNIAASKENFMQLTEDIDNTNAVDILKAIYEGSSDLLQEQKTKLFIPRSVYNAYCKDYQSTVGAIAYNREYKKTFLEGSDDLCELVPMFNKKNSDFIHLSTRENMLIGVYQLGDYEKVEIGKYSSLMLTFTATMFFGAQFDSISPERLFVAKLKQNA